MSEAERCPNCGQELEERRYTSGFTKNMEPIVRTFRCCPDYEGRAPAVIGGVEYCDGEADRD